jgi:hypothetical protein
MKNLTSTGTIANCGIRFSTGVNINGASSSFMANTTNMYSTPELIDTIVTKNTIELVYKKQYLVSNNWGMPNPEVYKEIYSRTDGTMRIEKGTYMPSQDESYQF